MNKKEMLDKIRRDGQTTPRTNITLSVPVDIHAFLNAQCQKYDTKVSKLINTLVTAFFEEELPPEALKSFEAYMERFQGGTSHTVKTKSFTNSHDVPIPYMENSAWDQKAYPNGVVLPPRATIHFQKTPRGAIIVNPDSGEQISYEEFKKLL